MLWMLFDPLTSSIDHPAPMLLAVSATLVPGGPALGLTLNLGGGGVATGMGETRRPAVCASADGGPAGGSAITSTTARTATAGRRPETTPEGPGTRAPDVGSSYRCRVGPAPWVGCPYSPTQRSAIAAPEPGGPPISRSTWSAVRPQNEQLPAGSAAAGAAALVGAEAPLGGADTRAGGASASSSA